MGCAIASRYGPADRKGGTPRFVRDQSEQGAGLAPSAGVEAPAPSRGALAHDGCGGFLAQDLAARGRVRFAARRARGRAPGAGGRDLLQVGHHPVAGERAVAGDDRLGDLGMRRVDVVGREPVAVEDRLLPPGQVGERPSWRASTFSKSR
jgi:hypothetical protein